ncbi:MULTISPECIES: type II secretion system F family protein [Pseudomonas]|uniref:Flp pilus assembly protein TadB n=1 Tax=Pseudomonas chlororaphis subsp. aureofaciens TaxID=587851 RepID=A0AAD0ZDS4_9PSED|nr:MULTISPECIES: type II secretion system F family protein [Pseudomonas]AIC17839.1 type II secretion system protein F [Pseudomonas chlororaphis]AZD64621.1 Flp pilus assembly protein TadB [Pseudomonas chlororaphis subsp. aurantiaca]AZD71092.1 Flp pilus assembly protein TadB [Pseudomonas chlororaphis subsp. aurantiaca]AZD77296.1 Flp pilus assembly protein TadB [Pseudomonas chlororaphis subsp. aurantiaca]AZE02888.1 Flp pilus assembly protein TadB [Pseudomonas chlororaphis subsp. aureofaciens]
MLGPVLLALLCLTLLGLSGWMFYSGLRQARTARVLDRLAQGQPQPSVEKTSWNRLERAFLRAGLGRPTERLGLWLAVWAAGCMLGYGLGKWPGLLALLVAPPLLLRLYISWLYRRRLKRMIEQLPPLLDHAVRSLKSGRTLADAVLGGIAAADNPLQHAMGRVQRNVLLGVNLPDAVADFAELYERDELRLFALGLKVNHRYGGNASELLENLIKLIRERDQAARQLRAMTGETRITAMVLAALPVSLAGYFLIANPTYLMSMWNQSGGQMMLLAAFGLQVVGCALLWRMLRSV